MKTLFYRTIAYCLAALLVCAGIVYYTDPFFHFHMSNKGVEPSICNEQYQNPGILRNFTYDSVLMGSSMTELLKPSYLEQDFDTTCVKVPVSAGLCKNYAMQLDEVFAHATPEEPIRYVFYGLDWFAMRDDPETVKWDLPMYLYDHNPFNDVEYLLNETVIWEGSLPAIVPTADKDTNFDAAYDWSDEYVFSEKEMLSHTGIDFSMERAEPVPTEKNENISANLENNILPYVCNNPQTQFYFFVPPYPITYWFTNRQTGHLPMVEADYQLVFETLTSYDNVHLFFFPMMPETLDLNNYMDDMHFSPMVADLMLYSLSRGMYEVTRDNYGDVLSEFIHLIDTYDYTVYAQK